MMVWYHVDDPDWLLVQPDGFDIIFQPDSGGRGATKPVGVQMIATTGTNLGGTGSSFELIRFSAFRCALDFWGEEASFLYNTGVRWCNYGTRWYQPIPGFLSWVFSISPQSQVVILMALWFGGHRLWVWFWLNIYKYDIIYIYTHIIYIYIYT